MTTPKPPRIPEWLIERLLPHAAADAAVGDLNEEFAAAVKRLGPRAARWWYWRQAVSLSRAYSHRRFNPDTKAGRSRSGLTRIDAMQQDIRYAVRALLRSPGYTAIGITVLALGIGATSAIFSFVDGVLLRPLPYRDPDQIVLLWEKPPGGGRNVISTDNFLDWQRQSRVFDAVVATVTSTMTMSGGAEPSQVRAARVSPGYFSVFGISTVLGRAFAPNEDEPGKDRVVVLSHRFWEQQFGGDPGVVGRTVSLDGAPFTIVGIMPADSPFDRGWAQVWRPLAFTPAEHSRDYHWLRAIARIRSGVTLEQAHANMDAIGATIARDYPKSNKDWGVTIDRLPDILIDPTLRRSLQILLGAVGLLLALGCANMANLALARGTAREREVTVCAALGASRGRIVRQFLIESLLLSCAAGFVGLACGFTLMRGLERLLPPYFLPREALVTMDWRAFAFAAAIAVATGLLFGVAPAFHAGRVDLSGSMRVSSRSATADRSRRRLRDVLVVTELAISCLLLAGASLLLRSFFEMRGVEVARNAHELLTARLSTHNTRFTTPDEARAFYRQVSERLRALPGVTDIALAASLPLQGWPDGMPMRFAAHPTLRAGGGFKMVEPSYFHTLGLPILRGRPLTDRDRSGTAPVIVVSDAFVKAYLRDTDPIGERVLIQEIVPGKPQLGPEIPWEIVGVVADERTNSLDGRGAAGVYATLEQSPVYGTSVILRTPGDPNALVAPLKAAIRDLDPNQPVTDVRTLEEIRDTFVAADRLRTWLLGVFSALALALAAIGIYGVISYSVAQRTHEIGVRAALGAGQGRILSMVMGHALLLTAIGLGVGLAAALATTTWMSTLLFGIKPRDPLSLGAGALVLGVVALVAAWVPARRAAAVDPIKALRVE
jgi:putative ABC transport system permease protein